MIIFLRGIVTKIIKFFFPAKIYGKENIPEGGAMIVCNHFSVLDPFYILSMCKKDIYFLSKKEATDVKVFGKVLIKAGAIPVDRDNPSMESIVKCIRTLKEDKKLVLYPEGTRNKSGTTELQEIKNGAAVFAVKARKVVVPVMMDKKMRLFRKVNVYVGKPFELDEFYGVKLDDAKNDEMNCVVRDKMKLTAIEGPVTYKKLKEPEKLALLEKREELTTEIAKVENVEAESTETLNG